MCGGMGKGKCVGAKLSWVLVIVGALNWGLVGLFKFNLVMALFGSVPTLERIVYILVGIAGVVMLVGCRCKTCKGGEGSCCETKKPVADMAGAKKM